MTKSECMDSILIVTPTLSFGGAEKVAVNLANSYALSGRKVTLAVFRLTGGYKDLVHYNVNVIDLNVSRTIFAFFKLFRLISCVKPDILISVIVEVNLVIGMIKPFLPAFRSLYRQANTMDLVNSKSLFSRGIYKLLMKLTYKHCSRIIANSLDTKRDLIINKISSEENIKIISNPVLPDDVYLLGAQAISHDWFKNDELDVLLSVGRLTYQKQHDLLIRVIHNLRLLRPNIRLVILGEGELYEDLYALIVELDLTSFVNIIAPVDNPFPFYKNAKLFVLASRYEGFGNVIVEAMAFGLNIVCNNCDGGPRALLEYGELGILADSNNVDSFTAAVVRQLDDGLTTASILIENSKKYRSDIIADEYLRAAE
jgi:glycosyltransferase involved in cell wall biosynthesis